MTRKPTTSIGVFIKQVRDLLFIVLVAIAIVVIDHYAFPFYRTKVCEYWSSLPLCGQPAGTETLPLPRPESFPFLYPLVEFVRSLTRR
jgi:hypothetical protein